MISYEEFSQNIHDRYNIDMPEAEPSYSRGDDETSDDTSQETSDDTPSGQIHDISQFKKNSDNDQNE